MKKHILHTIIILSSCMIFSTMAQEQKHTLSLGYARTNVKIGHQNMKMKDDPSGVNLKYRYEFNDKWGGVGSLTYTRAEDSQRYYGYKYISRSFDYFSLTAGPSFRFNDYVSVYGLVGVARNEAKVELFNNKASESKKGAAFAAGVQINPLTNWGIDAAYEYARTGEIKNGTWMLNATYWF